MEGDAPPSPTFDRYAIFRDTITMPWVEQYLNHQLADPLGFHTLLRQTYSDQPTHSRLYRDFLYSLPPIKLKWEWLTTEEQTAELKRLAASSKSKKTKVI